MKPPSDYAATTTAYYDSHASKFCEDTASVDMSKLYAPFLAEIPASGRILDAGCGSGRDSLAFLKAGYDVVPIDASLEMVKATNKLTGRDALLLAFDEIEFINEFDGIWACASLLHVSRGDLDAVLIRLTKALKATGVLYLSFKLGDAERFEHGRFFNDLNEPLLRSLLADHPCLETVKLWITDDVRNERRGGQQWLNALVRRRETERGGNHDLR
jgi:SAM-dependent methyltransferase